jgi:hypothetical protein
MRRAMRSSGARIAGSLSRTGATARIADEVADVRAVATFNDADAAVLHRGRDGGGGTRRLADVAGGGPIPDVAGDVADAVPIRAEGAEGSRGRIGGRRPGGFPVVCGEPAPGRIGGIAVDGERVVAVELAGGVGPLGVGREAETVSGFAGQPRGVGGGVVPVHTDHR